MLSLRQLLRRLFQRHTAENELKREMEHHLAMETDAELQYFQKLQNFKFLDPAQQEEVLKQCFGN